MYYLFKCVCMFRYAFGSGVAKLVQKPTKTHTLEAEVLGGGARAAGESYGTPLNRVVCPNSDTLP